MIEVVVPLYNEAENVPELHRRLVAACDKTAQRWKITFVDDGSSDETASLLKKHTAGDSRFQIIELSRNFGHQAAIRAGLDQVDADAVVLLDGDLQDPPELIPELVEAWQSGASVVLARRRSRQEKGLRRIGFETFHAIHKYLIDMQVPPNTGTFSLLDRDALTALNNLPEAHRFFPGLRSWVGFRQAMAGASRARSFPSTPKQTFRRLFAYATDGVLSYSFKPLRLMTFAGFSVCAIAFFTMVYFVMKRLLGFESAPMGFTTLCCAVFGLGGFQLVGMGILGEYVGRIYEESQAPGSAIHASKLARQQVGLRCLAATKPAVRDRGIPITGRSFDDILGQDDTATTSAPNQTSDWPRVTHHSARFS